MKYTGGARKTLTSTPRQTGVSAVAFSPGRGRYRQYCARSHHAPAVRHCGLRLSLLSARARCESSDGLAVSCGAAWQWETHEAQARLDVVNQLLDAVSRVAGRDHRRAPPVCTIHF